MKIENVDLLRNIIIENNINILNLRIYVINKVEMNIKNFI